MPRGTTAFRRARDRDGACARRWTRRRVLGLTALSLALVPALAAGTAQAQEPPPILTISRQRLLNETRYARAISRAEHRLTTELQARIDATKRELTDREQELTRLRGTLPRDEFEAQTAAFDRRVRSERREAQRLSAALQSAFRSERVKLLELLEGFIEQVRAERGASVILNRDDAIASDPALDITGEVIARFDETVSVPEMPDLDSILAEAREASPTEE